MRRGVGRRIVTKRTALVVLAVAGLAAACAPPKEPPPPPPLPPINMPCSASPGSPVAGNDPLRTGWYPDQPGLDPNAGGQCTFGELWAGQVNGQVYAAPLVDPGANPPNGTLLVATETNHVYGFDAVTGAQLWERSDLGPPWDANDINGPGGEQGCLDLTPAVGITGTPAIDPATHTAYFFSKTYVNNVATYKARAINVATGVDKPGFTTATIQGTADNDPLGPSFDAQRHLQRPGLLLMNGVVYAAFGGHCDFSPYRGWVVGVNASTGAITARWTDAALAPPPPSPLPYGYPGGGIWHAGGRFLSDASGDILLVSGNGLVPPAATPGTVAPTTLGESAIRLRVVTTPGPLQGHLQPVDFFSPCNAQDLSDKDLDIGSGAPLALPNSFGTNPHLLLVVGKSPTLYLLNRDNLGGFQQGSPNSCPDGSGHAGDAIVSTFDAPGLVGVWATPAVWPGDGGLIYLPYQSFASSAKFTAYRIASVGGTPTLEVAGQSNDDPYGFGTSSAIITSDGTASASALVWIVRLPDGSDVGAELRAYDANPAGGLLTLRGRYPIGQGTKFNTPTVDRGRIYVGARDGFVHAFGVLPQSAAQSPPPPPRRATANQVPDKEG
jgi:outer membrane protein assembly factor BamB